VPGLDGVRALAIVLVLFSHSVIYDQFGELKSNGLNAGYTGVTIFFVLSGYLITKLLLREEDQAGDISLRLFYLRRATRLFPALWLYLLVVFAIWLTGALPDHPLHSFFTSLFYVRNIVGRGHETDHLWSLSLEEQFYLLWPLVVVSLKGRDRARLVVATITLLIVTVWRAYAARAQIVSAGALYIRTDFRLDGPLFGCALALTERVAPRLTGVFNSSHKRSALLLVASLVGLAIWVIFRLEDRVYPGTDSTFASMLGLAFVLSQVGAGGPLTDLLTWAPLVGLGRVSYGVYLWQELFFGPRVNWFDQVRTFPLNVFLTIAVALASFFLLERPLLRLKDERFHRKTAIQSGPSR
jgi:peptidoglycan/LPS O-acetylase OafA/YrhL